MTIRLLMREDGSSQNNQVTMNNVPNFRMSGSKILVCLILNRSYFPTKQSHRDAVTTSTMPRTLSKLSLAHQHGMSVFDTHSTSARFHSPL